MQTVTLVNVPRLSLLNSTLPNAYFYDAYLSVNAQPERSPLQIWLDVIEQPAPWFERAMRLRNKIVGLLGLKTGEVVGIRQTKTVADYKVGDRVGLFAIYHLSENEIVFGENDKHLDVRLSLYKSEDGKQVTLSTVVHVHNFLGRVYMVFVNLPHRIIAPYMAAKI